MDLKKLRELAKDPRFISGIYNYCDRWCERCPMRARCLNYAMQQEEDRDPESQDIRSEAFWDRLHGVFEQTKEMILEDMKEQGVELDPAELDAIGKEEERRREEAKNHPAAQAAWRYGEMVDEWFEANKALFKAKGDALSAELRMRLPGAHPIAEAASLKDSVEVVHWHQHQIWVKLMRSLHRDAAEEELLDDEGKPYPRDSDGSAKVALVAMDRSIGAWGVLRNLLAAEGDNILDILVHLDRLRRSVERTFPQARAFIRPGFDEPAPAMEPGKPK